ncbi:MAG: bacteriohemerythrin [Proteobacteria bacterium]|nr:bacteriohemerythrin [Pseudomonadota bacterium]
MADYEPLVWSENFVTGVPEIDEQHRILVNTLNEANVRLAENSSPEFLEQITRDLLSYALYHFETEEALMQEYAYNDQSAEEADRHLREHRGFSAKVVAVREGLKGGILITREDLLSFLNNWLVNHILNTDKKLGAFIVQKRAGGPG